MCNPNNIGIKRLDHAHGLPLPQKMTRGSSGCDIVAAINNNMEIKPGERVLIPTGFCFDIPHGFELQVRPRSGLAWKYGITVLNAPGTVDSDYRGEVKIILINLSNESFVLKRGERIAQIVPVEIACSIHFKEREDLSETERGDGGFGHTVS
ncbi:MAG: dUTP diphosphatase [Chitinispirillia bacterium]|jgi:dUTP pyrophosphatase